MGTRPDSGFVRRSRPQSFCTDYTRLVYGGISSNQSESECVSMSAGPLASAVVPAVLMTAMQERKPLVAMTAMQKSKAVVLMTAEQESKAVVLMTDSETMLASQTETMMAPTVVTVVPPTRRKQGMQSLQ